MQRERGQSLVELALILPIMLLLLGIALDIGRGMMVYMNVVHAAREAAWVAAQPDGTQAAAVSAARTALADAGLDPDQAVVTVTIRPAGSPVDATVTYNYTPLMALLPIGPIPIRAVQTTVHW